MKNTISKSETEILRQKAEKLLQNKSTKSGSQLSEENTLKLIHELEVHQIELEMQNAELIQAKEKAEVAEGKYIELYDFAPVGYFTLSNEGKIVELNFCAARMLNKERSHLIKSSFAFFVSANTRAAFNLFFKNIFISKIKETCEVILSTEGNSLIYAQIDGIVFENGEQCLVTVFDITERKQAENELITAKEKAEESDHLKSAFLQNISHEIRTPMNAILGFSKLLLKPNFAEENRQQYINIVQLSANQLLTIVDNTITLAYIETKQLQITKMYFYPNDLLIILLKEHNKKKHTIEKSHIELILNKNEFIDFKVNSDYTRINQILNILLDNAFKFTEKGTINFGYNLSDNKIHFYVKDTGIGIQADKQQLIFKSFTQANKNIRQSFGGLGVGLSIASGLVKLLDGEIKINSQENIGTEIIFSLPV